jgi:hypothetical protein
VLTAADVPAGLLPEPRLSGPLNFLGVRGHASAFVAEGVQADLSSLPSLPAGSIVMAMSIAQVFGDGEFNPQTLAGMVRGARMGAQLGAEGAGNVVPEPPTELPDPPVGSESRALALSAAAAGEPYAVAFVLFYRDPAYVYLAVAAAGDDPPLAEATRLAQLVDARLQGTGGR